MINWIASFMLKLVCALCEYNYNILIENCVTVCRYGEEMATAIIDTASIALVKGTALSPLDCTLLSTAYIQFLQLYNY